MRRAIGKIVMLVTILIVVMGVQVSVSAETKEEQPFTIQPVLPKNQDKGVYHYISVSTQEDRLEQKVRYSIKNNTKEKMEIKIKPLNALTSPSGVIDYYEDDKRENSVITDDKYRMSQYMEVVDSIEVRSGETRFVDVKVDVSGIEGTVLGGIGFQTLKEGEIEEHGDASFQIDSEANVIMGLQVNFETEKEENFIIDEPFVDPLASYYVVRLPITLDAPMIASDVNVDYSVYDYKGKKLFDNNKKEFKFAPNTKANIPLPWEADEITENKLYTLKGTLEHNGRVIPFDKGFMFKGDKVDMGDDGGYNVPTVNKNMMWWVLALILILAILPYLLRRKTVYVLYTDSTEIEVVIEKDNELFDKVKPLKEVTKEEKEYKYELIYKPEKEKKEIVRYNYVKMNRLEK